MSVTALEILERARTLPWCQGAYAVDRGGRSVHSRSAGAVAWCLIGALMRAAVDLLPGEGLAAQDRVGVRAEAFVRKAVCEGRPKRLMISDFNDAPGRTEAEVRAVQDRAIELAREAGR